LVEKSKDVRETSIKKKVKNQTMVTVDADTDSALGIVIRCNFKPGIDGEIY
jgi:hypothetical protein